MFNVLIQHKSQVAPNKAKMMVGYQKLKLLWQKLKAGEPAIRVRKQNMKGGNLIKFKGFGRFRDKIKYLFYYKILGIGLPEKDKYYPTPKELSL
jgi:hypothetical protein